LTPQKSLCNLPRNRGLLTVLVQLSCGTLGLYHTIDLRVVPEAVLFE
jgi:hypothetical protein